MDLGRSSAESLHWLSVLRSTTRMQRIREMDPEVALVATSGSGKSVAPALRRQRVTCQLETICRQGQMGGTRHADPGSARPIAMRCRAHARQTRRSARWALAQIVYLVHELGLAET